MSLRKFFLKSNFTYKIYLVYNLFIRHKIFLKRKSYSQFGEDLEVINFFKNKKKGKYLDIGCFHPTMYSNTCLLYKRGWNGTNIDLNQTSIDLFNIARPHDLNLCRIIGSEEKKVQVYFDNLFSPVNTADKNFYTEHKKTFFKDQFIREVVSEKLQNIITRNNISEIDFINIDAEGMDYQILRQIKLDKMNVSLVAIETNHFSGEKTKDYLNIIHLLETNNFSLLKRCGPTTLFCKN
jgi:FkbM family methyltransferase